MATKKGKGGDGGGGGEEPQGPGKRPGDDPVRIHEAYIRRHLEGGAPATPEAYERALEQFRRLPGALRSPATEVTPNLPEVHRRRGEQDDDEGTPQ